MKMFCHTDQQCICYLCCMNEHQSHKTVEIKAERADRQKKLEKNLQKVQQRIQIREGEIKVLQEEEEEIKKHSDIAVKESEKVIDEMVSFIMEKGSELKQLIQSQQITELNRVQELKKKLEQETSELRTMDEQLKELLNTEDHTEFINNYSPPSKLSEFADSPNFKVGPATYFEDLQTAVSEARENLKSFLNEEWSNISLAVRSVDVLLLKPEPTTRDELLKYSCQLTVDPDSAHKLLHLSKQNKTVSEYSSVDSKFYLEKTDRFSLKYQVLSKKNLTGPCYWEVEWKGKGISVAVVHIDKRNLDQRGFGSNKKSWALDCYKDSYKFRHRNTTTQISGPLASKIGVYLDPRAGILSFYSISETVTLLHRVQTTFSQPLYAGLWIWHNVQLGTVATFNEIK
ncbi:tripartite motif-containing protein 16-like [Pholidichthys leucotaenia]